MYMTLKKDKKTLCEVKVYAHLTGNHRCFIDVSSWFNIQNVFSIYETLGDRKEHFAAWLVDIQGWRQDYNEGLDSRLPKPDSYILDDANDHRRFNDDRSAIISVFRERMRQMAQTFDLEYNED